MFDKETGLDVNKETTIKLIAPITIVMVSEMCGNAPIRGIYNSPFLSLEDSHNLMFLRETNVK